MGERRTAGVAVLIVLLGAALTFPPEPPARAAMAYDAPDPDAAVRAYWTPARMAAATPVDRRGGIVFQSAPSRTARPHPAIPTVGVLFFTSRRRQDHYCTASVVYSTRHNLVLTAGHCLYSYDRGDHRGHFRSHIAFVPRYHDARAPYGVWPARRLYVPRGWARRGDVDLDFGFVTLGRDRAGRNVADLTGANRLAPNVRPPRRVRVIGYPAAPNGGNRPIACDAMARRRFRWQLVFACGGFYGGTSGSPWLWRYDPARRQGRVIGVIGGYHAGGRTPHRSYSPLFDRDVARLRDTAERRG